MKENFEKLLLNNLKPPCIKGKVYICWLVYLIYIMYIMCIPALIISLVFLLNLPNKLPADLENITFIISKMNASKGILIFCSAVFILEEYVNKVKPA